MHLREDLSSIETVHIDSKMNRKSECSCSSDTSTQACYGDGWNIYSTNGDIPSKTYAHEQKRTRRKEATSRLTESFLTRREDYGKYLLSKRHNLWRKYGEQLAALEEEKKVLKEEEQKVSGEFSKRRYLIKKLHSELSDEDQKNYLSQVHLNMASPTDFNVNFKIGMTSIDTANMARYLSELKDEIRRLDINYQDLYEKVLGDIDRQIQQTLGSSALRCCTKMHALMEY